MSLFVIDWHSRFSQQARWTQDLRRYIYAQVGIENVQRVLDVGCGTGALEVELTECTQALIYGLDINREHLTQAVCHAPKVYYTEGNAHALPYPSAIFDLTQCHFLLLWVDNPEHVVAEMTRVTRPDGTVLALAEPDYGGRIDYPPELAKLGELQQESLRKQGADPQIGRRLAMIFSRGGLELIETGILGAQWKHPPTPEEQALEWMVLQSDLGNYIPPHEINKLRTLDKTAWARSERVLFVPTFYAWGRVPNR